VGLDGLTQTFRGIFENNEIHGDIRVQAGNRRNRPEDVFPAQPPGGNVHVRMIVKQLILKKRSKHPDPTRMKTLSQQIPRRAGNFSGPGSAFIALTGQSIKSTVRGFPVLLHGYRIYGCCRDH
jgi:hypothetical protein